MHKSYATQGQCGQVGVGYLPPFQSNLEKMNVNLKNELAEASLCTKSDGQVQPPRGKTLLAIGR